MNKKEFVELLSQKSGVRKRECDIVLAAAEKIIVDVCLKGGKIVFRGFGKIVPKSMSSHRCINPQTKRCYFSKSKKVCLF